MSASFIYFTKQDFGVDQFSGKRVFIEGWKYQCGVGLFDSFASALAHSMGLWEEYCEYHRNKQ